MIFLELENSPLSFATLLVQIRPHFNFAKNRRDEITVFCFAHISRFKGWCRGWMIFLKSENSPPSFVTPPVQIRPHFNIAKNRRDEITVFCFAHISRIKERCGGWQTFLETQNSPLSFAAIILKKDENPEIEKKPRG